jgi:hypothetical protein
MLPRKTTLVHPVYPCYPSHPSTAPRSSLCVLGMTENIGVSAVVSLFNTGIQVRIRTPSETVQSRVMAIYK